MKPYKHTPEELEMIERNARADEILRRAWAEQSYPPHDVEDAEWGECRCESCSEAEQRDPG
jgi:hypothetical protein